MKELTRLMQHTAISSLLMGGRIVETSRLRRVSTTVHLVRSEL